MYLFLTLQLQISCQVSEGVSEPASRVKFAISGSGWIREGSSLEVLLRAAKVQETRVDSIQSRVSRVLRVSGLDIGFSYLQ